MKNTINQPVIKKFEFLYLSLLDMNPKDQSVANMFTIDRLPAELQYKIMSYLTPAELCRFVAPVCKRWRDIAYDPILWQQLQLCSNKHSLVTMQQLLSRALLLRSLQVLHCPDVWFLSSSLLSCNKLISLDLSMCKGFCTSFVVLLCQCSPHLRELKLEGCGSVEDAAVVQMAEWKDLRSLNVAHCTKLSDESIIVIAKKCVHLQSLNIDGIPSLTDNAILVLLEERKSTLKKLYLDGDELTDMSYQAVKKCTRLVEFSISFAELIADRGLMAIKELSLLQHLKINRGLELTDIALKSLFEGKNLSMLTSLNLDNCMNLNDEGVIAMTKCCTKLESLDLAWCWDISDLGLEAIIENCRCLKMLSLVGLVKITGTCLKRIPDILLNLEFLDLQQCSNIHDEIIEGVLRRRPTLKAINYYGEEFSLSNHYPSL